MQNRDPMKEYFHLITKSVQLLSPHLNIIMNVNTNLLYERALHEGIPFFRWYKWVEETLNREVFKIIFHKKAEKKVD